jgi:hypothetical protein
MPSTRMRPLIALLVMLATVLASCATRRPPPDEFPGFRLPPSSLGRDLALQQRLTTRVRGRQPPPIDALLEVGRDQLSVALLAGGQAIARIHWDGQQIDADLPAQWPEAISSERLLSDIQLAFWPAPALRAALPSGWTLRASEGHRTLMQGERVVAVVEGARTAHVRLVNSAHRYELVIDSVALQGELPMEGE